MKPVYIDEEQIRLLISDQAPLAKNWLLNVFKLHYQNKCKQAIKSYLKYGPSIYDRGIALPALIELDEKAIFGMKWITSSSQNVRKGLARASALIVLNDSETMFPYAILEGGFISSFRTLALTLIVLDKFLRQAKRIGIIGMGTLGRMHATYLSQLYPEVETIYCYSQNAHFDDLLDLDKVKKVTCLQDLLQTSEVLITTTCAGSPYILPADLGAQVSLIINLSLIDFSLDVLTQSQHLIVDDWEQNAAAEKVFKTGIVAGMIARENVQELGHVLYGPHQNYSGRIFVNPIGLGIEDIYFADQIVKLISGNPNIL